MALESNERPGRPIAKFESMLKTDDVYFFDAEDFEEIIHYYLNQLINPDRHLCQNPKRQHMYFQNFYLDQK